MSAHTRFARSQRTTIVNGVLALVVLMVVLQLWLFTASVNAFLGGERDLVVPAALVSLACLGLNVGLLWYLHRLDARAPASHARPLEP